MDTTGPTDAQLLRGALDRLRAAYRADPYPERAVRADRLARLEAALIAHADRLVAAMSADFSHRSAFECRTFDITSSLGAIRHARRNLRRWMRTRRVRVPLHLASARAKVLPQPKGVVGVIAPWNFPVYLAVAPIADALAAGNRAMLKPSELAPRTAAAMRAMLAEAFTEDEVAVVEGGRDVGAAFAALPFDHLFFTGSTAVGQKVAEAAARNLTPVTLELGGKSPAIVTPSADLPRAARRIAWGRAASGGQVCVSPDYVLAPEGREAEVADAVMAAWRRFYPEGTASSDLSAIVSDRHLERLRGLVAEAEAAGARVMRLEETHDPALRKFPPTVILSPDPGLRVMKEEIFGPVLPVLGYGSTEEALAFVAERDRPLALYVFAEDAADRAPWLTGSLSGGMAINETILQVAVATLPFGGVGASGIGAYHGDAGFESFSHMKPVLTQTRWNGTSVVEPPIGAWKRRLAQLLGRIA